MAPGVFPSGPLQIEARLRKVELDVDQLKSQATVLIRELNTLNNQGNRDANRISVLEGDARSLRGVVDRNTRRIDDLVGGGQAAAGEFATKAQFNGLSNRVGVVENNLPNKLGRNELPDLGNTRIVVDSLSDPNRSRQFTASALGVDLDRLGFSVNNFGGKLDADRFIDGRVDAKVSTDALRARLDGTYASIARLNATIGKVDCINNSMLGLSGDMEESRKQMDVVSKFTENQGTAFGKISTAMNDMQKAFNIEADNAGKLPPPSVGTLMKGLKDKVFNKNLGVISSEFSLLQGWTGSTTTGGGKRTFFGNLRNIYAAMRDKFKACVGNV